MSDFTEDELIQMLAALIVERHHKGDGTIRQVVMGISQKLRNAAETITMGPPEIRDKNGKFILKLPDD